MFTADSWTLANVGVILAPDMMLSYLFINSPFILIWPQEECTREKLWNVFWLKSATYLLGSCCSEAIFLPFWWQLPEKWPQAGPTHGTPLRRRNFCPALGNHVPGTWHQTELLPIFSASTKLAKFYFGSLNLETIRGNFLKIAGCSIRQNYCQILCWLQKAQSMWC